MTESQALPDRTRRTVALVLLAVALVHLAVAASALFATSGMDPRETLGSRAAGFAFADWARPVLFSPFTAALPLSAVVAWNAARPVALGLYGLVLLLQIAVAVASLLFGLDVAGEQSAIAGTVFVDRWGAVERAVWDAGLIAVTVVTAVVAAAWGRPPKAA